MAFELGSLPFALAQFVPLIALTCLIYIAVNKSFFRRPYRFLLLGILVIIVGGVSFQWMKQIQNLTKDNTSQACQISQRDTTGNKTIKERCEQTKSILDKASNDIDNGSKFLDLLCASLAGSFLGLAFQFRAQNDHDSCRKREESLVQAAKTQLRTLRSERSELKKHQLALKAGIQEDEKLQDLISKSFKETELKKIDALLESNDSAQDTLLEDNNFSVDEFMDSRWLK